MIIYIFPKYYKFLITTKFSQNLVNTGSVVRGKILELYETYLVMLM